MIVIGNSSRRIKLSFHCIDIINCIFIIFDELNSIFYSRIIFLNFCYSFTIFLNIGCIRSNILLILSNITCICVDFSVCLIYSTIGILKMFFQIL